MRHDLLIPAEVLERALADLIRHANRSPADLHAVLTGPAFANERADATVWSVPRIALSGESGRGAAAPPQGAAHARAIVWWVPRNSRVPRSMSSWREWLSTAAHRSAADIPGSLVCVVVGEDGAVGGMVRHDDDLRPVTELRLPGPGMRRLRLMPTTGPARLPRHSALGPDGRFSRLAGALGPSVLAALQTSVIAMIGCGRTGSAAAHTIARYGAPLVLIDPDVVEDHNAGDGDVLLPGLHEGRPKTDALAAGLRPLIRPGAWVDARRLDVHSHLAGLLTAQADVLLSCVDDDRARLRCAQLAAAYQLPHLDIGVSLPLRDAGDAGIDVRLTLPGSGCLSCVGGFATFGPGAGHGRGIDSTRFQIGRRGSLRSLSVQAAHMGIRLLEQLFEGRVRGNRIIQVTEDALTGRLRLRDDTPAGSPSCELCGRLAGRGSVALTKLSRE